MKANKEISEKPDTVEQIWETGGKMYLTLPAALRFTKIDRGELRQKLARLPKDKKKDITKDRYVMVEYGYCQELVKNTALTEKINKIQELSQLEITDDDLQQLIEWKKAQK